MWQNSKNPPQVAPAGDFGVEPEPGEARSCVCGTLRGLGADLDGQVFDDLAQVFVDRHLVADLVA